MATTPSFATGYNLDEAQLTMTLSTFAYIDANPTPSDTTPAIQAARMRTDINTALKKSDYPGWQVVWGPGLNQDRSNMLFVAGNKTTNQYAVVIRGTVWTFVIDWLEDLTSILPLVYFPPANDTAVQIAAGTALGLTQLTTVTGTAGVDPTGPQTDLLTYLKQIADQADIFITGHSLGGCLASVLAPWLASSTGLGSADNLKVYTFAAPAAGNDAFASYYNNLFTNSSGVSTAYRVYNSLDVVPNAWASLPTIETYYPPFVTCPSEIQSLVNWAQGQISGSDYTQVGTDAGQSVVELTGHILYGPSTTAAAMDIIGDILFGLETTWQHQGANYLNLLGASQFSATTARLKSLALSQPAT